MTIDVSLEVIIGASLFVGGQVATLAGVVRSNISHGKRLGELEQWKTATLAVQRDRTQRHRAPVEGVPIQED